MRNHTKISNTRIMLLFLILSISVSLSRSTSVSEINSSHVNLTVDDGGDWKSHEINGGPALVAINPRELFFRCEAPFPIKWNISGYIAIPDIVNFQSSKREVHRNSSGGLDFRFIVLVDIFFSHSSSAAQASANVRCQHETRPEIGKSYSVFIKENLRLVRSAKSVEVWDSNMIPCATMDPLAPVNLLKNGRPVAAWNYKYDPLVGFTFLHPVEGNFTCMTNNETVNIQAHITRALVPGYDFSPKKDLVKSFTDEEIILTCSTMGRSTMKDDTALVGLHILVNIEWNYTLHTTTTIDAHTNSTLVISTIKSEKAGSGNATCVDENNRRIWRWKLEFIEPPILHLNNFEGEVSCQSTQQDRTLQTLRCEDPNHCEFMRDYCLADQSLCNFERQKQFYSEAAVRCWDPLNRRGYLCVAVPYSHINGIIQCTVGGLHKRFLFFATLEYLRRSSWEGLQPSELIQLDDVDSILYTNRTTTFFCKAVAFLFADDLTFSIEYRNGTNQFALAPDYNVTVLDGSSERKVDEFNILAELKINLPLEAVAIQCHAPWLNSTGYYSTERRFETRHLIPPTIVKQEESTEAELIRGSGRSQKLNCSAFGEPRPTYKWSKVSSDGPTDIKSDAVITTGPNGESLLEFNEVDVESEGSYVCTAENMVGQDSITFNVKTREPEEQTGAGSATYGSLIGIILFILLVVIVILGYVMNRYLKAQALLRGLTENEIEEFFQGRPELLQGPLRAEHLDFMAFDRAQYEINMEDLEFDESQILGSGEFSIVVKGKLRSRDLDAAVKIAKQSADVTLFKTLLSEVKIMIFIGKHDNVVAFFGAHTQDIQNRRIHIVLEMCENGSLEKYLRKGRQNFLNLIDQNQRLNLQILNSRPDAYGRMNTIDLVRWAKQIANGMEYLSYKGIVHADLAARNILLNKNLVAKISDFGLSKKLYECTNYIKKTKSPLPWRWMAIESLTTLAFSKESDLWSYGITIWEIFSLGDTPFPNERWDKEFVSRLASGVRMGKPRYATLEIYSQMVNCWENDPMERPEFFTLRRYFSELLQHMEVDNFPESEEFQSEISHETEPSFRSTVPADDLYVNLDPEGLPHYANFDPITGGPQPYSNVP